MTSWLSELTHSTSEQNDEKTGDKTQPDEENVTTYSEKNTNELRGEADTGVM